MISLVSTIFNDRAGLEGFFAAMAKQTHVPDEIVITDAGSRDGTWELMQAEAARTDRPWKFRALQEVRCNCARGRNLAIEQARGEIIVSTDIGCEWEPEWLADLAAPLVADSEVELVNGSWAVRWEDLHGVWAQVEWALKGDQRLEATAESYSSSRSIAYRKNTWQALGRYPEDLTLSADDAVFHYLIEQAGVRRVGAPKILCYWHRHESLKGFFKEAYRYGLGGGEAGIERKDVALIGGRMAMETVCFVFGLFCLWPKVPCAPWIGIALLAVAAISVLGKIFKMMKAIARLRAEGVSHPLLRLLVFNYGSKWHWLRGHVIGWRQGHSRCQDCRRRLREMTPATYQSRKGQANASRVAIPK
jgi:glycosyltransferase involved in cell wall biosynthesis